MPEGEEIRRYGVKVQTPRGGELEQAAEMLALVGYAIVDSGHSPARRDEIAATFEAVKLEQQQRFGLDRLKSIDEHNTIRAPLTLSEVFLDLAQNERILRLCEMLLGNAFILNQQNGIINPPNAIYNQGAWHRDLPYQHFVSTRPLSINALYCIDEFTLVNGATKVIPASHKQEAFPSEDVIRKLELAIVAPADSFIVLDCMTFHTGGANLSDRPRRAVNHVYSLPFIKQQIALPLSMTNRALSEQARRLLDFGNGSSADVAAYLAQREAKLKPQR